MVNHVLTTASWRGARGHADGRDGHRSSAGNVRHLRRSSSNTALVSAAVRVAPAGVAVSVYRQLAEMPPFNPDLDTDTAPIAISRLRAALDGCDAILICSPEYAHGVSGMLKNALDWVVGAESSSTNGSR